MNMKRIIFIFALVLMGTPAHAQLEVFATTTTYEVQGSTSWMEALAPWARVNDQYTIHSDAVVRAHGGDVFIINRWQADNILRLDAANNFAVGAQYSTGNGSNPQDLDILGPGRALISRYDEASAWIVNPANGSLISTVDLTAFSDSDGLPEMSQAIVLGGRAFLGLQLLDRNAGFALTGNSQVVVIDGATGNLVDANPVAAGVQGIALTLQNPFWRVSRELHSGFALFLCSGSFGALDGGIEAINPFSLQSEGSRLTESELGYELLDFVNVSPGEWFVLAQAPNFSTHLIQVSQGSGPPTLNILHSSPGFDLADLEYNAEAQLLYLADRAASAPGIRIFDATDGSFLGGPLSTGLPPFDLEIVDSRVTGSPSVSAQGPDALTVWPNPARGRALISMASGTVQPGESLLLFDLRGRRQAKLQANAEGRWELLHGRLPRGIYRLLRPATGATGEIRWSP